MASFGVPAVLFNRQTTDTTTNNRSRVGTYSGVSRTHSFFCRLRYSSAPVKHSATRRFVQYTSRSGTHGYSINRHDTDRTQNKSVSDSVAFPRKAISSNYGVFKRERKRERERERENALVLNS